MRRTLGVNNTVARVVKERCEHSVTKCLVSHANGAEQSSKEVASNFRKRVVSHAILDQSRHCTLLPSLYSKPRLNSQRTERGTRTRRTDERDTRTRPHESLHENTNTSPSVRHHGLPPRHVAISHRERCLEGVRELGGTALLSNTHVWR